jgi:hypothetical protein
VLGVVTLLIVVLVCGATTRLTRLIVDDRITLAVRQWVIHRYGGESLTSYLVMCPWCVSPYIATMVTIPAVWWGCDALPWHVRFVLSALLIPTASEVAGQLTKE